nr:unnamed protein product [Callosobruchus chinensis]
MGEETSGPGPFVDKAGGESSGNSITTVANTCGKPECHTTTVSPLELNMARTRQTTPQTKEERLRKKREAERRRYYRLKQDPVEEKNVVKPIKDLNNRDKRRKRKQWRAYSQKYRDKKRQIRVENECLVRRMHEDTPPLSEDEQERDGRRVTPENKYKFRAEKDMQEIGKREAVKIRTKTN